MKAYGMFSCMSKLVDEIRDAIQASDKTRYRLSKMTGISESQLCRLMSGQAGLSLDNVDRLVEALDLEIMVRPKKTAKKRKRR